MKNNFHEKNIQIKKVVYNVKKIIVREERKNGNSSISFRDYCLCASSHICISTTWCSISSDWINFRNRRYSKEKEKLEKKKQLVWQE